jgi:glycogen debranching enzyme
VAVVTSVDGEVVPPRFPATEPVELSEPAERMSAWREGSPRVRTPYTALARALQRSEEDLGALRIQDPDHPDVSVVAAGAPWFMTLFGRDSLIASWMMLPFNRTLALNTVRTLARYQGRRVDLMTEEQPGRILHEMRFGVDASLALGGGNVYYGTADATPLFVVLLGELSRWGVPGDDVLPLLSNADRALEWIADYGDADGDGFVEYARLTDRGLRNQGWKDSYDGINYADGRLATPPIALAEVQGYVYAAYIARAHFAREVGDETGIRRWRDKARALKEAFNERFWLPDRGWYAIALGPNKEPVDALASNMGHCLWSGIVDEDKAAQVAERLLSPEMFTGFGIRTLASSMGAYNPVSYHNGSVWPHDSALAATGLLRYGFADEAMRIATGLLDAADAFGGRLPELFCGFGRDEYAQPVRYPTSCSPQAWASATPVQLLRLMLRLDPGLPENRIWLDPVLPDGCRALHVENLRIADAPTTIDVQDGQVSVSGLPQDIQVIREPRDPVGRIIRTAS